MPFLVVCSATDILVGWESFDNRRSDLFMQVDQFLRNGLVRELFCLKNRLTGLFQQGMVIFPGQTENAQARSIRLFRKRSRSEGGFHQSCSLGTNPAGPLDQFIRVDILHKLMIGWHVLTQGGKTSVAGVARMDGN